MFSAKTHAISLERSVTLGADHDHRVQSVGGRKLPQLFFYLFFVVRDKDSGAPEMCQQGVAILLDAFDRPAGPRRVRTIGLRDSIRLLRPDTRSFRGVR